MQQPRRPACTIARLTALLLAYVLVVTSAPPGGAKGVAETRAVTASAPSGGPAGVNTPRGVTSVAARRRGPWRDGELLVRFRDGATPDDINSRLEAAGLKRGRSLWGRSGVERLTLSAGQDPRAVAESLNNAPEVAFAEPNYVIRADQASGPNDPRFPDQWALRNAGATGGTPGSDINVAGAWPVTRGSARTVVAVIDSGVDFTHPDLAANRWINRREQDAPGDDDGNRLADDLSGWDWIDDTGGGGDQAGHGTAVAGLIAAAGNNGAGVAGVMWRASLMSLRVLDRTGEGDVAAAVQAIDYAVANGAGVVNCSWGTEAPSAALKEAVGRAAAREVIVVASAGNDGRSLDSEPHYPAGYELPNVVAVASTDNSDRLAPLSNYGAARVHVAAPGQDVLTTRAGGDYAAASGTSASAALVAGVAGLMKTVNQRLRAAQVRESITRGARPAPALSGLVASGGVLDAGAAFGLLASIAAGNGRGSNGGGNNGGGAPPAGSAGVGNGRAAELSVRPLAPTRTLPYNDLPNLDELRTRRQQPPSAPSPVPSDRYSPGDGPRRPRASNPVTLTAMLAGLAARTLKAVLDGARAYPHAMTALDFYRDGGPYAASDTGAGLDLGVGRGAAADAVGDTTAHGTHVSAAPLAASVRAAFQPPPNNSTFSDQTVPVTMIGGQHYSVTVTMTNTGSNTWTSADLYRLGSQNPQDNVTWGTSRVHLTAPVAPGQSATFNFTVVAPQTPAYYNFRWRMVRDGVDWFGDYSTNVSVNVVAPGVAPGSNLAAGKSATQSSTVVGGVAARAVDGNTSGDWYGNSVTHTDAQSQAWWQVDLGGVSQIGEIKVWNRTDCCADRLSNFYVLVSDSPFSSFDLNATLGQPGVTAYHTAGYGGTPTTIAANRTGRYVRVQLAGANYLSLAEVEVSAGAGGGGAPAAGLAGYWKFDEGAGGAAADSSGNNFAGTLAGPSWAGGRAGNSVNFDGADDYVGMGAPAGLAAGSAFSVGAWVNPTGPGSMAHYGGIIVNREGEYELARFQDGTIQWAVANSSPGWNWVNTGAVAPPNQWTHVTFTYDGATAKTYVNGSLAHEQAVSGAIGDVDGSQNEFRVGGRQCCAQHFAGRIDEVRFYNRALSAAEAAQAAGAGGGGGGEPPSLSPLNRVGEPGDDLLSRNFNWSVPLVSLKGRSGLDLGLSLSYNSLVWTREGSTMVFDGDRGDPTHGFRLGFPVVRPLHYNGKSGASGRVLVLPSGRRVELRQIASSSNTYDAVDSSNLRLVDAGGGQLFLWSPDGTRVAFAALGGQHRLTEIKDRNGNYITVSYDGYGRVSTVTDTLGRVLTFNYDAYHKPLSITQTWRREVVSGNATVIQAETHEWATFGYTSLPVHTNFRDTAGNPLAVQGPQNGTSVPVLTQVGLADGTRFDFDYTTWGQVYRVTRMTKDDDQVWRPRSHVRYDLPLDASSPRSDCPRFSQRFDWAESWNVDASGVAREAATTYSQWDANGALSEVTTPDGVTNKEFYATAGWQRGLVTQTEVWAGGVRKKYTTVGWEQDSQYVNFRLNPRPVDVNVYDTTVSPARHRRTQTVYTAYGLPDEVYEYEGCCTVLRRTHLEYNFGAAYTSRRVIGLVSARMLYDGAGALQSMVGYGYDVGGEFLQQQGAPVRHDAAGYGTGFVEGRGLVTSVSRYNVNNRSEFFTSRTGYNTTGSPIFTRDPKGHQTAVGYADAFTSAADPEQNVSYNTYAYPTTMTDGDGHSSAVQYNYDIGAVRRTQDPKGAATRTLYDAAGRPARVTNLASGSYKRWAYPSNLKHAERFTTLRDEGGEDYSVEFFNGTGAVRAIAGYHPYSAGGWRMQRFESDVMGRPVRQTNMTEINGAWAAVGDDAAGYQWTQQSYDWMGRPLVTTNADGTTREMTYGSCGCAGGQVVTARDEVGRRLRTTSDALGREWKAEVLNMDGTVYSTTTHRYNTRDQITRTRVYAGTAPAQEPEGEGIGYQTTTMTYDGHGRLSSSKAPIQSAPVTYAYDTDDVLLSATDPRGVVTTYGFTNQRHLVNTVTRTNTPQGMLTPAPVAYEYDAAGNRTRMEDGTGVTAYAYNALSQLTSETRTFAGVSGSHTITYGYTVAGQVRYVIDPAGSRVDYGYDLLGRLLAVTGSGAHSAPSYAANLRYRAWGALKDVDYGNGAHQFVGYNSKLQPAAMELRNVHLGASNPNGTMAWGYEYYSDGRIERTTDGNDGRFTRRLDYDLAGRLKEAYSGPEAVGQPPLSPPNISPFRQSFGYDAFGNMTNRTGRLWRQTLPGEDADYQNDRREWSDYDAAGNVLTDGSHENTYDAAGSQTLSRGPLNGCGTSYEIAQSYDGDGRPARREQTQRVEGESAGGQATCTTEVETILYVYATALGGARIVELDEQGNKLKGYVYANGARLARQEVNPYFIGGFSLTYHHDNPGTTSWVETKADRSFERQEMDPLGADTGAHDPYLITPDPSYGGHIHGESPLFSEGGNPLDLSGGCGRGGMPGPCGGGAGAAFWGSRLADLPGFGTNWGSFSDLAESMYEERLDNYRSGRGFSTSEEIANQQDTAQPDPCADQILIPFTLTDSTEAGGLPNINLINTLVAAEFNAALQEINQHLSQQNPPQSVIGFNEVFRDTERQRGLYNDYRENLRRWQSANPRTRSRRAPAPAAPPGTSPHEAGVAFDIPTRYRSDRVIEILANHGFTRPIVEVEPWHFVWEGWSTVIGRDAYIQQAQDYYNNCVVNGRQ